MLETVHKSKGLQLFIGLLIGFCFGFLLQRSGVTRYEVIMGQLLLYDWTVTKVILTAILTGMIGIYYMNSRGLVKLHKKTGSFGANVIGGLIFGLGFGILGYCPGTVAGAAGQGSMDALFGGVLGILIGAGIYARIYPWVSRYILKIGDFGDITVPEALGVNLWHVVLGVGIIILVMFTILEIAGL